MKRNPLLKLVRHSLGEDGSTPARRSPWPAGKSKTKCREAFNRRVLFGSVGCQRASFLRYSALARFRTPLPRQTQTPTDKELAK